MIYEPSWLAIGVFAFFVITVLGISFWLGSRGKSASGYFAAHGEVHWLVNGVAFAGDYLSAASFLGICGMIAFYGYDGFLYSIGYLAGWLVALFVVAEPLKRLGKYTFADALDQRFNSRGIKVAAGISALVVSLFYLIPQMVGAGALIQPLLGLSHAVGVITVGVTVILIVVTAGMVSTTWVQFIKGALLLLLCTLLTIGILNRGLQVADASGADAIGRRILTQAEIGQLAVGKKLEVAFEGKPYLKIAGEGTTPATLWKPIGEPVRYYEVQTVATIDGKKIVNGRPLGKGAEEGQLTRIGQLESLADGKPETGALNPFTFLSSIQSSRVILWGSEDVVDPSGKKLKLYFQKPTAGSEILTPGGSPTFSGLRSSKWTDKADFLSLMLALFAGTASLPHILIRYYTVKDERSARQSTVVGIFCIGFFYVLTLFLGLGAMTSGTLDPTNNNMSAPLMARSFGELPFAVISAVAFTTVLGTVSGLILAASGAVAHDLLAHGFRIKLNDHEKVRCAKIAAVVVGVIAIWLGIVFEKFNVTFLVGWAFNVAASANLPALILLLFWKRTTREGIIASILVGMISSLGWILLSGQAYKDIYGLPADQSYMPFSQPGLVTIPLAFVVLIVVSLLTQSGQKK